MPKMKTVKSVRDRFKITSTGKVMAFRAGRRHLLSGKRAKLKRHLRRPEVLSSVETRKLKTLIPYSG